MPKYHKQHQKMVENATYHMTIYHPNKPNKIRVLFESSVEFNGGSTNQELIPDPGLVNQLVGILTRFREKKVAFMADLEKCIFKYLLLRNIDAF